MKLLGYLLKIAIYSILAFILVSPCLGTWGFSVCCTISFFVGFIWGLLNEIYAQLLLLIDLIKKKKQ